MMKKNNLFHSLIGSCFNFYHKQNAHNKKILQWILTRCLVVEEFGGVDLFATDPDCLSERRNGVVVRFPKVIRVQSVHINQCIAASNSLN